MAPQYEPPTVKDLGRISDLTQSKPGIYLRFPRLIRRKHQPPPPGAPGTVS